MPAQTSSINQPQVNLQNTTSKDIKTSSNNQLNANSGGGNIEQLSKLLSKIKRFLLTF
jgi:hypothetical protein